mmetsp:Transcript_120611/g.240164  ORF Transcript_120611/g.240164 Transcript_120611/m.240164 type:complete len:395 (+) Transcript_120611:79-1263(+)
MARTVPTFLVGAEEQEEMLEHFQRRCLHYSEIHVERKPMCFSARAYQRTHPEKKLQGSKDADATLASPMLLGVCDGVSQVDSLGLDASRLPKELLKSCEELVSSQLLACDKGPRRPVRQEAYSGPTALLKEAYSKTKSLGSTSVLIAVLDNTSLIHGRPHPMIGVCTLGDCELILLRRSGGRQSRFQVVFHTEAQRIGGHSQTPLQVARMRESIDPAFSEDGMLDAIDRGSGLHCSSTYEGDILVLGSDGVFDNLFVSEVVEICNQRLPPAPVPRAGCFVPANPDLLSDIATTIVEKAHSKSQLQRDRTLPNTPLGAGGKADDTSVVVAEVVEWTRAGREAWERRNRPLPKWSDLFACGPGRTPGCHKGLKRSASSDSDCSVDDSSLVEDCRIL